MKLGEHIANLQENYSGYARRLKLPIPTITRYLRGERGMSAHSIKIILADAAGALTIDDLLPNPYKGNGGGEATKK